MSIGAMNDEGLPDVFGDISADDFFDASDYQSEPSTQANIFLTDLPDIFEGAEIPFTELDGWRTRGRRGGEGFKAGPLAITVHHTASNTSEANDVNYMTFNAQYRPIANLYIGREGQVVIMTGGASNHAGSGSGVPWGSVVPDNSMNSYGIGIECANNGVGQSWSQAQRDRIVQVCAVLAAAYNIPLLEVHAHYEWAPWRKIDPAGPPAPDYMLPSDGSLRWDMPKFRADVAAYQTPGDSVMSDVTEILNPARRLLDSRDFGQEDGRIPAEGVTTITVPNAGDAVAAMVTITAVDPDGAGFMTVWAGGSRPEVSCLNYVDRQTIANTTTVPLTDAGKFQLFSKADSHVVVDLVALYR